MTTLKLDWIDEVEADENGDDFVTSSESSCERFSITPNWYDSEAEKPVDYTLEDNTTKKKTSQRSAAACKKVAVEIINRPPPKVWTHDELIQNAANAYHMNIASKNERTRKWAERDAVNASETLGVDVRTIPMSEAFKAQLAKMIGAQS